MCSAAGFRVPALFFIFRATTEIYTGVGTPTSRPLSTTSPFM